MKQLLICLLFCFTCLGCEEETPPPFSKEKIQEILIQIHLTDASVTSLLGEMKDSMAQVYMEQVKAINKLTADDIESIFNYLKNNPAFAEEIYGNIITEINERQLEDKKDKKEKEKKKDTEQSNDKEQKENKAQKKEVPK